jgi:Zn-dependent protease/CBS domain-containing protein
MNGMNGNIRIGNLFGIPFYINLTWFLVLALVTLSYGGQLAGAFPQLGTVAPWLLGLATALLVFASVLAHELGHSFVALRQGINVKSITLFLFGGLASLEEESKTPAGAFWVAIAGPIVSLLLFGAFKTIELGTPVSGPLAAVVWLLATINLILALFNLIPGLPLDGGNVLKSAVWKITGSPYRGIFIASRVGQLIGWLAIAIGALGVLGVSPIGSFWTLLIGFFLLQNAGRSAQSASVQEKLSGLTAEDAVTPNSPIVSAETTLREFANEYVIGQNQWRKFLVTDGAGRPLGRLPVDDMKTVPTSQWTEACVRDIMQPGGIETTVKSDLSLLEAVMVLERQQQKQLPVVRENGTLVGLLEKASIRQILEGSADGEESQQAHPA